MNGCWLIDAFIEHLGVPDDMLIQQCLRPFVLLLRAELTSATVLRTVETPGGNQGRDENSVLSVLFTDVPITMVVHHNYHESL